MRLARPAWWWLPYADVCAGRWVVWSERRWWMLRWERLVRPWWMLVIRLGLWDVADGCVFQSGRVRWRFWSAPYAWWNVRVTALSRALRSADESAREAFDRGYRAGHRDALEGLLGDLDARRARSV